MFAGLQVAASDRDMDEEEPCRHVTPGEEQTALVMVEVENSKVADPEEDTSLLCLRESMMTAGVACSAGRSDCPCRFPS